MASGAESSHMQINEGGHDEGEACRGQAGAPIVDAELLKDEHRAPVVERRLLKPGMTVEVGRNAGAELPFDRVSGIKAVKHFVRDLRIARLVGAHQTEPITAEQRRLSVDDEEGSENKKDGSFANGGPVGQAFASALR